MTSPSGFKQFATVILDIPIEKPLQYGIPAHLENQVHCGSLIKVPLKGGTRYGAVVEVGQQANYPNIKPILGLAEDSCVFTRELFELSVWISDYYCTPIEEVFRAIVPSSIRGKANRKEQYFVSRAKSKEELKEAAIALRQKSPKQADTLDALLVVKKGLFLSELIDLGSTRPTIQSLVKKGFLTLDLIRVDRSPLQNEEYFPTKAKTLNEEQAVALESIKKSLSRFQTHLLWGITGSGKTEVYLQAIEEALKQGKGSIVLVPEISLTAQTIERFRSRFEGTIAILHSQLSHGERFDEWTKIAKGEAKIVIGVRSSIFSPVQNLGLIIVDEEHDPSYKQSESMPCYHARDVAVMRGKYASATVILGSATPSLESFYNCTLGKYTLNTLKKRTLQSDLPKVSLVDMSREYSKAKGWTIFSEELLNALEKRIQKGEQSILFLNRRGYHTLLMCPACGQSEKCPHCDVSLTFHKHENSLSCHLCSFEKAPPPSQCTSCHAATLKFKGIGTEQVEKALHAIFKEVRTLRLDRDTTKHKGSHQKLLASFKSGKADILIGTQMIAKGLHFPEVTFVGVLNCDQALHIPDYRASELTFQLLTQVSGRAGRAFLSGEVIFQTALPDNKTILCASNQDFESFYQEEIKLRELFNYPPFSQLVKVRLSGKEINRVSKDLEQFRAKTIAALPQACEISPIMASGHAKIKDSYRFQFLIKGPRNVPLSKILKNLLQSERRPRHQKPFIDVNPLSTFF